MTSYAILLLKPERQIEMGKLVLNTAALVPSTAIPARVSPWTRAFPKTTVAHGQAISTPPRAHVSSLKPPWMGHHRRLEPHDMVGATACSAIPLRLVQCRGQLPALLCQRPLELVRVLVPAQRLGAVELPLAEVAGEYSRLSWGGGGRVEVEP